MTKQEDGLSHIAFHPAAGANLRPFGAPPSRGRREKSKILPVMEKAVKREYRCRTQSLPRIVISSEARNLCHSRSGDRCLEVPNGKPHTRRLSGIAPYTRDEPPAPFRISHSIEAFIPDEGAIRPTTKFDESVFLKRIRASLRGSLSASSSHGDRSRKARCVSAPRFPATTAPQGAERAAPSVSSSRGSSPTDFPPAWKSDGPSPPHTSSAQGRRMRFLPSPGVPPSRSKMPSSRGRASSDARGRYRRRATAYAA